MATNIYSGLGERTNLVVSKSKDHTITITITLSSAAFDISSYTFVAKFYTLDGLKIASPFLTLTQGSGITNGGATGILTIALTDTQTNLTANEYFWELITTAPTDDRWFNGVFEVVDHLWDSGNSSTATVNLTIGGNNLALSLNVSSLTLALLGSTLQTASADTPLDADTFNFYDAVDAVLKKITWANIKATLTTLYQLLIISETVISDGASITLTGQNNTLASSQSAINVAVTNTSTFLTLTVTLTGTSLVLTFTDSASTRCINSDGTKSGDNTCTLSGTTGDVYEVGLKKRGSGIYSVIAQNINE